MDSIFKLFNLKSEDVNSLLISTGACIAGSSVLASLTNSFQPNDIDIWLNDSVNSTNSIKIKQFLDLNNYEPICSKNSYYYTKYTVENFFNYEINKNIQIIYVKNDIRTIVSEFDLTICSVYYDGLNTNALYMDDINSRIMKVKNTWSAHKLESRIKKYSERGFTLVE
jgi:hypothetical protein